MSLVAVGLFGENLGLELKVDEFLGFRVEFLERFVWEYPKFWYRIPDG